MSVSVVIKNACETTGEGPYWDPVTKSLLFVDINNGGIHRWNSVTNTDESVHLDESVSFIIPSSKGGYIIGLGRTIAHFDWNSKTTKKLYEAEKKGSKNRFNDAKCDPSGRLWAGTMGHETTPAVPETEMGILVSMDSDGSVKQRLDKVNISNGLAWSKDHKTMYYIDSLPRKVVAFDFDINSGAISNERTVIDFSTKPVAEQLQLRFPDGMCIDTEDKLWVACFYASKVIRIDPATGQILQEVQFPQAQCITSCCFGGENLDELYVTCSKYGVTEEDFKTTQPLAGSVFKVTGLGIKGVPVPEYNDQIKN